MDKELQVLERFFCWFAGFVDGEGTIGITKRNPQPKHGTNHHTYRAYLSISTTSTELMFFIKSKLDQYLGGNIGQIGTYKQKNKGHKDYTQISIAKFSHLKRVLIKLEPYLILKKDQASLVRQFIESREQQKRGRHVGTNILDHEIQKYNNVKKLNIRGR